MLLQTIFQQFLEVHLIQPFSRSYNENDKLKKIQTLFLKVGKNGKNSRLWHFIIQRGGKDKLLTLSRMSNKNSHTIIFLADQDSSIGDVVTESLSRSVSFWLQTTMTNMTTKTSMTTMWLQCDYNVNTMTTMTTMTTKTTKTAVTAITTMATETAIKVDSDNSYND